MHLCICTPYHHSSTISLFSHTFKCFIYWSTLSVSSASMIQPAIYAAQPRGFKPQRVHEKLLIHMTKGIDCLETSINFCTGSFWSFTYIISLLCWIQLDSAQGDVSNTDSGCVICDKDWEPSRNQLGHTVGELEKPWKIKSCLGTSYAYKNSFVTRLTSEVAWFNLFRMGYVKVEVKMLQLKSKASWLLDSITPGQLLHFLFFYRCCD